MRLVYGYALAVAAVMSAPNIIGAQQAETARSVAGGGITAPGWAGKVEPNEEKNGQSVNNGKLAMEGKDLHVTTGPAVAYWMPSNVAKGNYTVKATFTEDKFMGLNNHPHPYGLFIGGNDMGTDKQSYLYCTAYGDGRFIVRGFNGDSTFRLNGRGDANPAIHKAAGVGSPVTQEIALSVKGDKVECAINGTVVGSYDKSAVVGPNKLTSTDGVYGIRFGHNTEGTVKGLSLTKN